MSSKPRIVEMQGRLSPQEEQAQAERWHREFNEQQDRAIADLVEWQEAKQATRAAVRLAAAPSPPEGTIGGALAKELKRIKALASDAEAMQQKMVPDAPASYECQACQDTGNWIRWNSKTKRTDHKPCPICAGARAEKARVALAAEIAHRWPIDAYAQRISKQPWDDNRDGATEATQEARRLADSIMEEMPSPTTLFLIGEATEAQGALYGVGTGKTRLLAEIALTARGRGYSAILATAERLRGHVQDYPRDWMTEEQKEEKGKKLALVERHLKEAEVLCIDEMGWERGEKFSEYMLELLNHRIGANKTTCIATNVPRRAILPVLSRLHASNNMWVDLSGDRDARQGRQ